MTSLLSRPLWRHFSASAASHVDCRCIYLFAPAGGSSGLLIGCDEPLNPSSYPRENPKLPAMWRRHEPVSFCFKSGPLRCMNMGWSRICTCISECICIMAETWKMVPGPFSSPPSLKQSNPPLCIGRTGLNVSCCSLRGSATLPRLLMPYLLLIRMSRLSATICCSCSTNFLPAVWCRWGAQWPSRSVPAPDLKRLFSFVVPSFKKHAWVNSGAQAEGGPGRVWKASGRGSPARIGAASELLDLSWQMLQQKKGVMVLC